MEERKKGGDSAGGERVQWGDEVGELGKEEQDRGMWAWKGLVEGAKGDSGRNRVEVRKLMGGGGIIIKEDKGFRRDPFTCSFLHSPSVCIDLRGREDRSAKEGVGETHGRDTKRGRDLGFK